MSSEPWDLPVEESSRIPLRELAAKYESEQKPREAGICYSRLAHLLKHIGPLKEAALCGQKALFYLRQTDDKQELARALRVALVPFVTTSELDNLRESLALAREIGDREQEAWTIYRYTRALSPPADLMEKWQRLDQAKQTEMYRAWRDEAMDGHTVEEALAIFEELEHLAGIATCLVSLGIEQKPHRRDLFERAIELFRRIGDEQSVARTQMMADTFAPLPQPWDLPNEASSIPILMNLVETYRGEGKVEELGLSLSRLSEFTMRFGTLDGSDKGKAAFAYASEAAKVIRQLHRGTDYCQALLNAGSSMVSARCTSFLKRAAKRAEQIGELKILAWATFRLASTYGDSDYTLETALEYFQDLGDSEGIAACETWLATKVLTRST